MARRKSPTKTELLQLQKLYKTDEKIGERLGGVEAYLVAYWRRKKNIPKYSLPKFSEQEVQNLWERFGDDEKAGLELGISKAAFYNWRRRYGFREKPAFLKLEQLEFNFIGKPGVGGSALYGQRTLARKIIARILNRETVESGEEVTLEPDLALTPSGAGDVIARFRESGSEFVWNPGKIVVTSGGEIGENGPAGVNHAFTREFTRRQGIKAHYGSHEGTRYQLVMERGHILPGQLALVRGGYGSPLGSLGALALEIDITDMSGLWRNGTHSLTVPPSVQAIIGGRRPHGLSAADIALFMILSTKDKPLGGSVLECTGSVISQMSINERSVFSSICSVMDVAGVICQYDATTRRYLVGRTDTRFSPLLPDKDAEYEGVYQLSIDSLTPLLAGPNDFTNVRPVAELAGMTINQVIIGSCLGGRFDELRAAADILKGKKIHPDCRLLVIPGSRATYLEAIKKGLIRVFVEAGAILLHPAYCPCGSTGNLAKGERCLSTAPPHCGRKKNSNGTEWYLGSPVTAAAAALEGGITEPDRFHR